MCNMSLDYKKKGNVIYYLLTIIIWDFSNMRVTYVGLLGKAAFIYTCSTGSGILEV